MKTLKQFIKDNENKSIWQFAWSVYWRAIVLVYAVIFGIYFCALVLAFMIMTLLGT